MGADYPSATWMPAHQSNFRLGRPVAKPDLVVIHCTDGRGIAERVGEMWQTPEHRSSAHFCVGQNGSVVQSVRVSDTAWHAHEANGRGIGIEHCARTPRGLGHDDPGLPPSMALYTMSSRLVAWLCARYAILPSRVAIVGHAEADHTTTHSLCPTGCGWDWSIYMGMVMSEYSKQAMVA